MVLALGLACLYIMKTPPVYTRVATLLFKDEYSGESNLSAEISTSFATMGLANQRTNVFNEMVALQSPSLMVDVAKRLQLYMNYTVVGCFYNRPLYGKTLPVSVSLVDIPDEVGAGLTVRILNAKDVELSAFYKNEDVYEKTIKTTFGVATQTPIGKVIVTPSAAFLKQAIGGVELSKEEKTIEDALEGDTGAEEGMVRFFINIGRNQKIKPGDILGAVAGEAKIPGRVVGAIDIHDGYTFVEVPKECAKDVWQAMKNVKIKGKSVCVEPANSR